MSEEHVAVVTGAAGLIGTAICAELRDTGAVVAALDTVAGGGEDEFHVDVADPASVDVVAAQVGRRYGRVDWLVHAAALTARSPGPARTGALATLDLDAWNEMLRVNLTGALVVAQGFLPLLRRSPAPAIVLLGSIQGLVPSLHSGAYGVSKAALCGLTRQLAAELASEDITVNLLAPGPIVDPAQISAVPATRPTPLGRFGSPQEVAGTVLAILQPSVRFMTGAVIPIDGGEHLRPRTPPRSAPFTRADTRGCS